MSRTYSNVVVAGSRSKATLAVGFEMCRVDGGIVVMPIYDEGRALHRDIRLAVECLPERCRCLQVCRQLWSRANRGGNGVGGVEE